MTRADSADLFWVGVIAAVCGLLLFELADVSRAVLGLAHATSLLGGVLMGLSGSRWMS